MPEFSNKNNNYNYQGEDHSAEFDAEDIEKNKVISSLTYLGILFFLPLIVCPESKFGKFHANQGLLLLIADIVLGISSGIIGGIFHLIPFVGWIAGGLINTVVGIFLLALLVMGLVNTLNGKAKEIPLIGKIKLIS